MRGSRWAVAAVAIALGAMPACAQAAPTPLAYQQGDTCKGRCLDVLPPGTNGLANLTDLASFEATGQTPEHSSDQRDMYGNLVYQTGVLGPQGLNRFYKDHSFGVKPADVDTDRTVSPRADVTIIRDKQFGVPHIYGSTRDGVMFGAGYAAAQDRLFLMDALRHVGRGELTSFAGGSPGNQHQEQEQWAVAPYSEADLQRQYDQFPSLYGSRGTQLQRDAQNYTAGVNKYISEAKLDPNKMPAEYAAIGKPQGPSTWKPTDIIATAGLVGGIFGKGGGRELESALALQAATSRFGHVNGRKTFRDFRNAENPNAPTTVHGKSFPYQATPHRTTGVAMPDRKSVSFADLTRDETGSGADSGGGGSTLGSLFGNDIPGLQLPKTTSNALLVSGAKTQKGAPIAVFGPQTGQFAPNLLMEEELQGPGLSASGAAFAGTNLYVQLGRGRSYAWSATSAGQDIIDTFAVRLCNPDGSRPSKDSLYYEFHGACTKMDVLEKHNAWTPNFADQTPPGSYTLHAERTKLGLVVARATRHGHPVAYVNLRSTYFHEVDSALGFADFNDPDAIRSPQDWMKAANRIGYTFNWFYVDKRHIAYFNSGWNPERQPNQDPNLPVTGTARNEWRGYDPSTNLSQRTPFGEHPQTVDQPTLTSWNNKQAPGFRAADSQWGYQASYRSRMLDVNIARELAHGPMRVGNLVRAMNNAATTDLRALDDLPFALRVIGDPSKIGNDRVRRAVKLLAAWHNDPVERDQRRDLNRDGSYDHAEAIRIMDAWWPLWVKAQFKPRMGNDFYHLVTGLSGIHDGPRGEGGSAFQGGFYGNVRQDLRRVLGISDPGRFRYPYCGRGDLSKCRKVLLDSLDAALDVPESKLYASDKGDCSGDVQYCNDATEFQALGAITQPKVHWVNRPTYQQVIQFPAAARSGTGGSGGQNPAFTGSVDAAHDGGATSTQP